MIYPREAPAISAYEAERLAEIFGAMSDPSRVRMLTLMLGGEQNVSALAAAVGISESAASHHLRNLRLMRLVRTRKEGRAVFYALDDAHIEQLLALGLEHVRHG